MLTTARQILVHWALQAPQPRPPRRVGVAPQLASTAVLALCVLSLMCLPALVHAQPSVAQAARDSQIELTRFVAGEIQVDARGNVTGHALRDAGDLPDGIEQMLSTAVPRWRFEPVLEGTRAVPVTAQMLIRFVAKPAESGDYLVSMPWASFWLPEAQTNEVQQFSRPIHSSRLGAIASSVGFDASIFVAVRANAEGEIVDARVRQVTLHGLGDANAIQIAQSQYAHEARIAARRAQFYPLPPEELDESGHYEALLPIEVCLSDCNRAPPGQWALRVVGPVQPLPWREETTEARQDGDAASDRKRNDLRRHLTLLTPLVTD